MQARQAIGESAARKAAIKETKGLPGSNDRQEKKPGTKPRGDIGHPFRNRQMRTLKRMGSPPSPGEAGMGLKSDAR